MLQVAEGAADQAPEGGRGEGGERRGDDDLMHTYLHFTCNWSRLWALFGS